MGKIYYVKKDQLIRDEEFDLIFEIDGKNCKDEQSFFTEFATKLEFPDYFGRNWDAFDDCIGDLGWLWPSVNKALIKIKNIDFILKNEKNEIEQFYDIFFKAVDWNQKTVEQKKEFGEPLTSFFLVIESGDFEMLEEISKRYPEVETVNLDLRK